MALIIYILLIYYLFLSVCGNNDFVYPCETPNAELGVCISIFSCPILMKSLGTLQPTAIHFVKHSVCCDYSNRDLKVCCGTRGNYLGIQDVTLTSTSLPSPLTTPSISTEAQTIQTTTMRTLFTSTLNNSTQVPPTSTQKQLAELKTNRTVEEHRDYVKKKLLPSKTYCGLQHTDDRFYNENITALDEFPWLVHVIFLDDEDEDTLQYLDRCNGVLISNRYILTIGSCANLAPAVRLGQHNVNKTISCIADPQLPECNEPKYDVLVEEEIHRAKDGEIVKHDFALLRLAQKVQYSDFVRPICLPLPEYKLPEKIDSLVFSGWGAESQEIAAIKKRLIYNLTDGIDECLKIDDSDLKDFTSNNSVICLTPNEENTELACTGDEGGPLMYSYRHQWFAEGLLTIVYDWYQEGKLTGVYKNHTVDSCSDSLPIGGIKITSEILDWIMDNMRP